MTDQPEQTKTHCNSCGRETNHKVLASDLEEWEETTDDGFCTIYGSITFEMLKCLGCDSVTLRRKEMFSEWDGVKVDYFPPPTSHRRPVWIKELPKELHGLLEEVYTALHAGSHRLGVMGARTVIERVAHDKLSADPGTFNQILNQLERQGFVGTASTPVLAAALEAGHAATHRGHRASADDINDVMNIIEHLLHAVYILPNAANRLSKSVPPRPAKRT